MLKTMEQGKAGAWVRGEIEEIQCFAGMISFCYGGDDLFPSNMPTMQKKATSAPLRKACEVLNKAHPDDVREITVTEFATGVLHIEATIYSHREEENRLSKRVVTLVTPR